MFLGIKASDMQWKLMDSMKRRSLSVKFGKGKQECSVKLYAGYTLCACLDPQYIYKINIIHNVLLVSIYCILFLWPF